MLKLGQSHYDSIRQHGEETYPHECCGVLMGSVERGKTADLVLVDGNPLEDIGNMLRIAGVFAKGRYYSRSDLDTILAASR